MEDNFEFFATCSAGFEDVLADELRYLGVRRVRPLKGGVAFFAPIEMGYKACLWLRSASRVLLVLDRVNAANADDLYDAVYNIEWERHIPVDGTIAVSARGMNKELRNSKFTALKVKDALCDRLRDKRGKRPDVQTQRPDVAIWVSLHNHKATVSLDFAGESLHRRGYRKSGVQVEAPIKEALAAGMLLKSGWTTRSLEKKKWDALCDPCCGSGTFVIEAALIACDCAPGLLRDYWGFEGWSQYDEEAFNALLDEADERFERGYEEAPRMVGLDIDPAAIELAESNAKRAGIARLLSFQAMDCASLPVGLKRAGIKLDAHGLVVANPPYGVRLLEGQLEHFYEQFSEGIAALPATWDMTVITPDTTFDASIGFEAYRAQQVFNGAIESTMRQYRLGKKATHEITIEALDGSTKKVEALSEHADQFAARFRKVAKQRKKWAKKNSVSAYRLYDADLPDYSLAIDFIEASRTCRGGELGPLEDYLVVSEYKAPHEIDPNKAARRFKDACTLCAALLSIPEDRVFARVRKQEKGGKQYACEERESFVVYTQEGGHIFELDLRGYLDTGLFLDHRVTRSLVEEKAAGKRFLNLFAYTGSVSVYAACGHAAQTTTVDLSQTYLDWAQRNMRRAGFSGSEHRFVKANVLEWAHEQAKKNPASYDLIFVDPPTFSNSKSMGEQTWDIQRDHADLLADLKALLAPGGEVIFSGNLRSFKLDKDALYKLGYVVEDITELTIPEDFTRNRKIHFCYRLC